MRFVGGKAVDGLKKPAGIPPEWDGPLRDGSRSGEGSLLGNDRD